MGALLVERSILILDDHGLSDGGLLKGVRDDSLVVKALRPEVGADGHVRATPVLLFAALHVLSLVLILGVLEPKVGFGLFHRLEFLLLVRVTLFAEVDGELVQLLLALLVSLLDLRFELLSLGLVQTVRLGLVAQLLWLIDKEMLVECGHLSLVVLILNVDLKSPLVF